MPHTRESRQAAGRVGGLRAAALTVDRSAHTKPARDARLQQFLDQVPADAADVLQKINYMTTVAAVYKATVQSQGTGGTGAILFNFEDALTILTAGQ